MREDFNNLENWMPVLFPSIHRHTVYGIESTGESRYLKAVSRASSSGLLYKQEFDVYRSPNIRWRWKVDSVYTGENAEMANRKQGDDYPIRILLLFKFDPNLVDPPRRFTYQAAKRRYGDYPPHSALAYVWASSSTAEPIITSPYSQYTRIVSLQRGGERIMRWIDENRNILEDYRLAFGEDPPATATLAILSDSDDMGQSSVSYLEFIEITDSSNQ